MRVADSVEAQPRKHEKRSRNGIGHAHGCRGSGLVFVDCGCGMTGVELRRSLRSRNATAGIERLESAKASLCGWPSARRVAVACHAQRTESVAPGEHNTWLLANQPTLGSAICGGWPG